MFIIYTLKEETFADRNFRGFAVFYPFRESFCPRNFLIWSSAKDIRNFFDPVRNNNSDDDGDKRIQRKSSPPDVTKISTRKTLLFQRFAKINTRKCFVEKAIFNAVFSLLLIFYTISFNLRPCQEEKSACAINRTCDLICMCDGLSLALFARAIYLFSVAHKLVSWKLQKPIAFAKPCNSTIRTETSNSPMIMFNL